MILRNIIVTITGINMKGEEMKVLFVMHNTEKYSGANLAMIEVISELSDDIEKVIMFPDTNGSAVEYAKEKGFKTISADYCTLMLSQRDSSLKNALKYFLNFIRQLKMVVSVNRIKKSLSEIDLIYTNTSAIKFGLMLSKALNIPHIWHIREFGDKDHGLLYPFGKRHYYKNTTNGRNRVITISQCLISDIKKYFNAGNIHLVYDNVSPNYINPDKESDIDNLSVLIAGDIKEGKGQFIAVQAINEIVCKGIKNVKLYIAGKIGDQKYYDEMMSYIDTNNLKDYIIFLGHVADMNGLRRKMDVGIVASQSEAFGRVTVEGMLSNMAMVGRNTGATVELIQDGINGLLYDGTVGNLSDKLIELTDSNLRMKLSHNAFEYAKKNFTEGSCSSEVEKIIKRVYGEKNG